MGHGLDLFLFLTFSLPVSSAVTHSLQYLYTEVKPAIHFPEFTAVGLVDGEQFAYYDSNIRRYIPKTEWIQKVNADDPGYWVTETRSHRYQQETFRVSVAAVMQHFQHIQGVHTLQRMFGCELHDDSTVTGHLQDGYDGEDFISLDVRTESWTALRPQAEITKLMWESGEERPEYWKSYLEKGCIERLKKFVSYGRETLERKVRPEVSVFQKHSPSPEVVCHATGFFPKAVMITWRKDGEEVNKGVELRETLPNQDGSFQKRSILKVPAEELQKHTYTCVVQHSSLEKELVLPVSESQNDGGERSGGAPIAVINGAVVGLAALIALVAGTVSFDPDCQGNKTGRREEEMEINKQRVL